MTMPAEETLERESGKLWVTDAELIRRLGAPEKITRENLRMLDNKPTSRNSRKQKLWGDRRYWPAVKAYFDQLHGIKVANQQPSRGERYATAR